jgi:hypothetical protein
MTTAQQGAAIDRRAIAIVEAWKAAHRLPYLSPEACRDLAERIARAIVGVPARADPQPEDYAAFVDRTLAEIAARAGLSYEEIAARLTPLPERVITITNPAPAASWVRPMFDTKTAEP